MFRPVFSATAEDVREFIAAGQGGTQARLAFVDMDAEGRPLCFLDFSGTDNRPSASSPPRGIPRVPVISPDGDWVVYASGAGAEAGSALSQRSSVYLVRMREDAVPVLIAADSACEPRFVQAAQGRLEILYTTLAPNLGWEGFGKTLKVSVDVSGADAGGAAIPEVVAADGSYTGGLSWDGRYLCGGGGHVAMRDLQSGGGRPDTVSYQGVQSCNASISSSRLYTSTLMYLNTSGQHPGTQRRHGLGGMAGHPHRRQGRARCARDSCIPPIRSTAWKPIRPRSRGRNGIIANGPTIPTSPPPP